MDPSKRLYIKGLPKDVTRQDIVDLIRRRTRANPQHIDIAVDVEGNPKGYAHCSVEGLKSVLETIQNVPIRGSYVTTEQAKPHYSVAIVTARRERERAERQVEMALEQEKEQFDAKRKERLASDEPFDRLRPPPTFFLKRQKYAKVAANIARQAKDEHRKYWGDYPSQQDAGGKRKRGDGEPDAALPKKRGKDDKKGVKKVTVVAPKEPTPPPQPSKEERKITGIQAKLAALKAKMAAKKK